MEILNSIKCELCGKRAIGYLNTTWLCGDCIVKYEKKLKEQFKTLMMEENMPCHGKKKGGKK